MFFFRFGQILNCGLDRTSEKSFFDALLESQKEWKVQVQNYTSTESLNLEAANGKIMNIVELYQRSLSLMLC